MIDVYINDIKFNRESFIAGDEEVFHLKNCKVSAMIRIKKEGIPDIINSTYIFNIEEMPDSILELENKIASMYSVT